MGKVVVIGASPDPKRYSFHAVKKLLLQGKEVIAIGKRKGTIGTCQIITNKPDLKDIDLIILYINSGNQKEYYNYFLQLNPKRILFNPGTENPEFAGMAIENKIEVLYDCALTLMRSRVL